jgi:hypothetical protein
VNYGELFKVFLYDADERKGFALYKESNETYIRVIAEKIYKNN